MTSSPYWPQLTLRLLAYWLQLCILVSTDCTLFDKCASIDFGRTPLALPCVYKTPKPPEALPPAVLQKLSTMCPHLFHDNSDSSRKMCCSAGQVDVLFNQMSAAMQILKRCESCVDNFAKLWCDFTCHPDQHQFVKVVKANSTSDGKLFAERVQYHLSREFASGVFNSCKNVKFMSSNAINLMCASEGGACTMEKWLKFMGTKDYTSRIPFDIDFIPEGKQSLQYVPKTAFTPCNKRVRPSSSACACSDCEDSCKASNALIIPRENTDECHIYLNLACYPRETLHAFLLFIAVIFVTFVLFHFMVKQRCKELIAFACNVCPIPMALFLDESIKQRSERYGAFAATHPSKILTFGFLIFLIVALPIYKIQFSDDHLDMWSVEHSEVRVEKKIFDENFEPFMRAEQLTVQLQKFPENKSLAENFTSSFGQEFGPAFQIPMLEYAFKLVDTIKSLSVSLCTDEGADPEDLADCVHIENITLNDICIKPLGENSSCLIMSPTSYFQNNITKFWTKTEIEESEEDDLFGDEEYDESAEFYQYTEHLEDCIRNPMSLRSRLKISCLGDYGGPIQPQFIFGSENSLNASYASAILITFPVQNKIEIRKFAMAWEKVLADTLRNMHHTTYTITFMTERSLSDEIQHEATSDSETIVFAYVMMLICLLFFISQYVFNFKDLRSLFVSTRINVTIAGMVLVGISVLSSMGIIAMNGFRPTLILLLVLPLVVLIIWSNHAFILIRAYQRCRLDLALEQKVSVICGECFSSILYSTLSCVMCFIITSFSIIPTISIFSMCCALALIINFLLQATAFFSLLIFDIKRSESGRPEFCCIQITDLNPTSKGYVFLALRIFYRFLLRQIYAKLVVVFTFVGASVVSVFMLQNVKVGMDHRLPLPVTSHVIRQFDSISRFHSVGPPVYFVITGDLDFSSPHVQRAFCTTGNCEDDSLGNILRMAGQQPDRYYIADVTSLNWVDDFLDWQDPAGEPPCCRQQNGTSIFCSAREKNDKCLSCGTRREDFYKRLDYFVHDMPTEQCPKGGAAAYSKAIKTNTRKNVKASYFMAFHTKLSTTEDFTFALKKARILAGYIQEKLQRMTGVQNIHVFPYSVFYVFYDVYLHLVAEAARLLTAAFCAILLICFVDFGYDFRLTLITLSTIIATPLMVLAFMPLLGLELNPLTLLNIFITMAISTEMSIHTARAFRYSNCKERIERSIEVSCSMASSVFTSTFLPLVLVATPMAICSVQILQYYYSYMIATMALAGLFNAIIVLPVLLAMFGSLTNGQQHSENSWWQLKYTYQDVKKEFSVVGHDISHLNSPAKEGSSFCIKSSSADALLNKVPITEFRGKATIPEMELSADDQDFELENAVAL